MSFNFSVSESSEHWYGASNSFPLMTRLRRARGKALVSSLGSSIWLAGGNSLPRACSPARDCHCVDYCVWIATFWQCHFEFIQCDTKKCLFKAVSCLYMYIYSCICRFVQTWPCREGLQQPTRLIQSKCPKLQWSTTMRCARTVSGF